MESGPHKTQAKYFANLDILRTVAFLMVFWLHGFNQLFSLEMQTISPVYRSLTETGGEGVRIFFVLSGFLITYLLLHEYAATKKINVLSFYMRRVLRIWPLYYLVLAMSFLIAPVSRLFCLDVSPWKGLLFLVNFQIDKSLECLPNHYAALWSVSIEEQFYLVWPLFCLVLFPKKYFFIMASVIIVAAGFLFKFTHHSDLSYYHTAGNMQYLAVGGIGAFIFSRNQPFIARLFSGKIALIPAYLCGILLFLFRFHEDYAGIISILLPLFYLFSIVHLCTEGIGKSMVANALRSTGKYTYGLYLYHFWAIIFTKIAFDKLGIDYRYSFENGIMLGLISLAASGIVSVLSYHLFEKKILRMKKKFNPGNNIPAPEPKFIKP